MRRWKAALLTYFDTNGGTEVINRIIECGRRIAHGSRSFEHYRRRVFLVTAGVDASPHT